MKILNPSRAVYEGIKNAGIDFVVSVPCVYLSKVLELVENDKDITHIPVNREEEGFGIAAGAYIAGKNTAILMQNSGLGNSVNVLASLYLFYGIPILMVISHRGTKGEKIEAQVPMGNATPKILHSLKIPTFKPETAVEAKDKIVEAWNIAYENKTPTAILLEVSFWKE